MGSPEERGAVSWVSVTVGGLAGLVVLLLIANLVFHPGRDTATVSSHPISASAGPEQGADVAPYVASRRQATSATTLPGWVVVSFASYQTPATVRTLAGATPVGALLVAARGGFAETIASSDAAVRSWVSATRARAATDAAGIRQMLPTAGDPQTIADFNADLTRLAVVATVDGAEPIVFGAVLNVSAVDAHRLSAAPGVRLVDPIGATLPDLVGIRGLRPEEITTAGSPPTRPT
jgi:hypothetical protein